MSYVPPITDANRDRLKPIMDCLEKTPGGLLAREVAPLLGVSPRRATEWLRAMAKDGMIVPVTPSSHCKRWTLIEHVEQARRDLLAGRASVYEQRKLDEAARLDELEEARVADEWSDKPIIKRTVPASGARPLTGLGPRSVFDAAVA